MSLMAWQGHILYQEVGYDGMGRIGQAGWWVMGRDRQRVAEAGKQLQKDYQFSLVGRLPTLRITRFSVLSPKLLLYEVGVFCRRTSTKKIIIPA